MAAKTSPNSSELFIWASPARQCCATKPNAIMLKCMKAQQRQEQIKFWEICKLKSITSSNSQCHPPSSVTSITPLSLWGWGAGCSQEELLLLFRCHHSAHGQATCSTRPLCSLPNLSPLLWQNQSKSGLWACTMHKPTFSLNDDEVQASKLKSLRNLKEKQT